MNKASLSQLFALDQKGERILDCAATLIKRYGYDKTTMQDIAAEATISKSTLYSYWKHKEDLFNVLIRREAAQMFMEWVERVEDDPEGGTLFSIYQHGFLTLIANPLMKAFYTHESAVLGNYVRQRGPTVYLRPYLLNRMLIEQLQAAKLMRTDLSPAITNHVLMIISVGLFSINELVPQDQVPSIETTVDALADMVQRALAPEQPGDPVQGKRALRTYLDQLLQQPSDERFNSESL